MITSKLLLKGMCEDKPWIVAYLCNVYALGLGQVREVVHAARPGHGVRLAQAPAASKKG